MRKVAFLFPLLFFTFGLFIPLIYICFLLPVTGFKTTLGSFPIELVFYSVKTALIVATASVAMSAFVGGFFAYLDLSLVHFPSRLVRAMSLLCFSLPTLLVALSQIGFWGRSGVLGTWLATEFCFSFYGYVAILIAHTFLNFAVFFRPLQLHLRESGMAEEAAALSLGAGRLQTFIWVTWPKIWPVVRASSFLVFLYCWMSFVIVLTLGGGIGFTTPEVLIYQALKVDFNLPLALRLTFLQCVFSLFLFFVARPKIKDISSGALSRFLFPVYRIESKGCRLLLSVVGGTILMVLVVGPLGTLAWEGILAFPSLDFGMVAQSLGYSILIGSVVATLAVGTALLGVWYGKRVLLGPSALSWLLLYRIPIALSSVILSFALLQSYGSLSFFQGSFAGPILAQTLLVLPLVAGVLSSEIDKIPRILLFAGQSLGASEVLNFRYVEFPLLTRAVKTAWLMAFGFSIGEVGSFLVFNVSEISTLPMLVYRLMGKYDFQSAYAVALVLMAVFTGLFWMFERKLEKA